MAALEAEICGRGTRSYPLQTKLYPLRQHLPLLTLHQIKHLNHLLLPLDLLLQGLPELCPFRHQLAQNLPQILNHQNHNIHQNSLRPHRQHHQRPQNPSPNRLLQEGGQLPYQGDPSSPAVLAWPVLQVDHRPARTILLSQRPMGILKVDLYQLQEDLLCKEPVPTWGR